MPSLSKKSPFPYNLLWPGILRVPLARVDQRYAISIEVQMNPSFTLPFQLLQKTCTRFTNLSPYTMSYLTLKLILNFHIDPYFTLNLCESFADTYVKFNTMFLPVCSYVTI